MGLVVSGLLVVVRLVVVGLVVSGLLVVVGLVVSGLLVDAGLVDVDACRPFSVMNLLGAIEKNLFKHVQTTDIAHVKK